MTFKKKPRMIFASAKIREKKRGSYRRAVLEVALLCAGGLIYNTFMADLEPETPRVEIIQEYVDSETINHQAAINSNRPKYR